MLTNITFQAIPGWFDFPEIYEKAVQRAKDGAHFVEVGVYFGRSACFMALEIVASGKQIRFDAIDLFKFDTPHPEQRTAEWDAAEQLTDLVGATWATICANREAMICKYGSQLRACRKFLKAAGVLDHVRLIQQDSASAASQYAPASLDFVWLDAGHDYATVLADLQAWVPKVKAGGVIGGHDYYHDGSEEQVRAAVDGFFGVKPESARCGESSWLVQR